MCTLAFTGGHPPILGCWGRLLQGEIDAINVFILSTCHLTCLPHFWLQGGVVNIISVFNWKKGGVFLGAVKMVYFVPVYTIISYYLTFFFVICHYCQFSVLWLKVRDDSKLKQNVLKQSIWFNLKYKTIDLKNIGINKKATLQSIYALK